MVQPNKSILCSGRSNFGQCDASIHLDLHALEALVEKYLIKILAQCLAEDILSQEDTITDDLHDIDFTLTPCYHENV